MVNATCDNPKCDDEIMVLTNTDSRSEWCDETYECPICGAIKVHRITFDQRGFVISDTLEDEI